MGFNKLIYTIYEREIEILNSYNQNQENSFLHIF